MKDEIKEILNQLEYFNEEDYKYYSDFELNRNQIKQLLDYITNLQQENDNLKNIISSVKEDFLNSNNELTNLQQENKDLKETIKSINAISYQSDDEIWLNVRHYIEDLDEFASDIDHYIAPYITYNYKSHLRAIIKYLVRFFKQHCAYKR